MTLPSEALVAPLVETTRGVSASEGVVENVHFGAVAVVNAAGEVLHYAGDPHYPTFTRSALKPLQCLPLVESHGIAALGLEAADLAMFCASHSGEPRHVERVAAILAKIGLSESDLQCGCQVPIYYATLGQEGAAWCGVHAAPSQLLGQAHRHACLVSPESGRSQQLSRARSSATTPDPSAPVRTDAARRRSGPGRHRRVFGAELPGTAVCAGALFMRASQRATRMPRRLRSARFSKR